MHDSQGCKSIAADRAMTDPINNIDVKNFGSALSDMGKHILEKCPRAYVNEYGQVVDPCHVWWTEPNDPTKWEPING